VTSRVLLVGYSVRRSRSKARKGRQIIPKIKKFHVFEELNALSGGLEA
jgi:hypothetical protein